MVEKELCNMIPVNHVFTGIYKLTEFEYNVKDSVFTSAYRDFHFILGIPPNGFSLLVVKSI